MENRLETTESGPSYESRQFRLFGCGLVHFISCWFEGRDLSLLLKQSCQLLRFIFRKDVVKPSIARVANVNYAISLHHVRFSHCCPLANVLGISGFMAYLSSPRFFKNSSIPRTSIFMAIGGVLGNESVRSL